MSAAEEKTCENCKFFIKHYTKTNNGRLQHPSNMVHCINGDMKKRTYKKILLNIQNCEKWEQGELKTAERQQNIKEVLRSMHKRLDEIAMILEDDNAL